MKLVATDVTVVVLNDTGHWILEEKPKETADALVKFPSSFPFNRAENFGTLINFWTPYYGQARWDGNLVGKADLILFSLIACFRLGRQLTQTTRDKQRFAGDPF